MKLNLSDKPFEYGDRVRLYNSKVREIPEGGVVCEIQESDIGGCLDFVPEEEYSDVFHTDKFEYSAISPSPTTIQIWLEDGDAELVEDT